MDYIFLEVSGFVIISNVITLTFLSFSKLAVRRLMLINYLQVQLNEHVYSPVVLFYLVCLHFAGDSTLHPLILD